VNKEVDWWCNCFNLLDDGSDTDSLDPAHNVTVTVSHFPQLDGTQIESFPQVAHPVIKAVTPSSILPGSYYSLIFFTLCFYHLFLIFLLIYLYRSSSTNLVLFIFCLVFLPFLYFFHFFFRHRFSYDSFLHIYSSFPSC
jgi:hypothetical protein